MTPRVFTFQSKESTPHTSLDSSDSNLLTGSRPPLLSHGRSIELQQYDTAYSIAKSHTSNISHDRSQFHFQHCPEASLLSDENHPQRSEHSCLELDTLQKTQQEAVEVRSGLFESRLRLKEKRNELRDKRSQESEIDISFFSYIRTSGAQCIVPDSPEIEQFYGEIQAIRDEIGSLQYEYDLMEDEYEVAEMELEEKEDLLLILYKRYFGQVDDNEDCDESDLHSFPKPFEGESVWSLDTWRDKLEDGPLDEYQSRLGDANIAQEQLHDALYTLKKAKEFNYMRESIGAEATKEAIETTDHLELKCLRLQEDLQLIQSDVEALWEGLVESGRQVSRPTWFQVSQPAPVSEPVSPASIEETVVMTHRSESALPHLRKEYRTARKRINEWICNKLAGSPIERVRLKAMVEALQNRALDDTTWDSLFLAYRRSDEHWPKRTFGFLNEPFIDESSMAIDDCNSRLYGYSQGVACAKERVISNTKPRNAPYCDDFLDLDMFSQYESRSN